MSITKRLLLAVIACGTLCAGATDRLAVPVTDASFSCISKLTPVRGFFVGNLSGHLSDTLKVARSKDGGVYPVGSVVQLVPTEVMVKQPAGFNSVTHDWEFFELDVDVQGSKIRKRGFAEVVNRFGGNCFGCHIAARPQWDLICETDHGCAPIPLTTPMIRALQHTDPRCPGSTKVSAEDGKALQALAELQKVGPPPVNGSAAH
ncbi:MAG TPA: hypothetical protein VFW44_15065 [Bryobacteraceae bacterium]|nr:hypothetical protein [Bryobacteraceae bacterium]